jgi:hypothetical protein
MDVCAAQPRASFREREKVESQLAANRSGSVDYQIRPTSSSRPVEDIRLIVLSNRRELSSTPGRPAIFPQERLKLRPYFPFAPGVPQRPAPAASGLDVCGRGRVDDHPDGTGAVWPAKPEQVGNAPSGGFCLIPSPQLNVELKHGGEIVVEGEPVPSRKALPLQPPQAVNCFSQLSV